eukprot:scaffold1160_cov261-Pinguiococcus_pyrenoidosus.AAC.2
MGGNAPPDAVSKELVHALNSKLCAPEGESTAGDWYEDLHHLWASQLSDQEESGQVSASSVPAVSSVGSASTSRDTSRDRQTMLTRLRPFVQPKWYSKALAYWDNEENCPPTIDGVLGGFGHVSGVDLVASRQFLSQLRLQNPQLGSQKAVECGAGIGRVVKGLLLEHFEHVELVEPSPRLLKAAEAYVAPGSGGGSGSGSGSGSKSGSGEAEKRRSGEAEKRRRREAEALSRVSFVWESGNKKQEKVPEAGRDDPNPSCDDGIGMQEYSPPERSLDLVWVQWAIGHLTDADFFSFLRRCERALRPGGVVCLKENCSASGHLVDSEDSSITRTKDYFQRVFELANMELVLEMEQEHFPDDLYPVFMFAIRPKAAIESDSRQEPVEAKEGTTGA